MSEAFVEIDHGAVYRCEAGSPYQVAVTSRCVKTAEGELVCSFVLRASLEANEGVVALSRSRDGGRTWTAPEAVWPDLADTCQLVCSISAAPDGRLLLWGMRTPIDAPGESVWCEETQGLKQNDLVWSESVDGGRSWRRPAAIPMPEAGSAEAPGAMCVTRSGVMLGPYAPYNTFDPNLKVDREQVIVVRSADGGESWHHASMLRFAEAGSGAAEAWVVELADGRLLGTSWHMNMVDRKNYPNGYALSHDGGLTWTPTRSTGTKGHTTVLTPLPDGRALFGCVVRDDRVGISLAVVSPTEEDFGIQSQQMIFEAPRATQSGGNPQHDQWKDFCFGEPSLTLVDAETLLVTYWSIEPAFRGVRSMRFRMR